MSDIPQAIPEPGDKSCPICAGAGEVCYIDEEVGCRVCEPCPICHPVAPPRPS
ncbi:MAG TPA: hypothetical protein VGO76_04510 [Luteibacter sp.]|jgi:hypothetical protein|nr:hypothetical protein [Luteibacter sp.]